MKFFKKPDEAKDLQLDSQVREEVARNRRYKMRSILRKWLKKTSSAALVITYLTKLLRTYSKKPWQS